MFEAHYPADVAGMASFDEASRHALHHQSRGEFREALAWYRRVLTLRPGRADVHHNLAHALSSLGRSDEAAYHFEMAISLRPDYPLALTGLGSLHYAAGNYIEAAECCRRALERRPDLLIARFTLGVSLQIAGDPEAARTHLEIALADKAIPDSAWSQYLLCLNYLSSISPEELTQAHRRYGARLVRPAPASYANVADPERRLRIGYVSVEFREHLGGYFLMPLFEHADRKRFEIVAYSGLPAPVHDERTAWFRERADLWRSTEGVGDESLAEMFRADGIDILVDLAGHSGLNRLSAMAGHPAPVQITWLGYPNTSGLPAMDYRLVDGTSDPEGVADAHATETLIRLPECFLGMRPPDQSPEVAPLPCLKDGVFTFGSFNTAAKTTPEVLHLWKSVLDAVPNSRLLLKSGAFERPAAAAAMRRRCADAGIALERVALAGWTATRDEHLLTYAQVDLALDPFPYNGTITTCDALWMGVPVLTMPGDRHAARVGASLMQAAGLSAFVAEGPDDYVARAVAFAADRGRLASLRSSMRDRLRGSALCDTRRFVVDLEAAYRDTWRRWCART
jgi:protein O-GlcNAc transferase